MLWRAFGSGVSSGRCLVPAAKLVIEWDERVKEDGMVSNVMGEAILELDGVEVCVKYTGEEGSFDDKILEGPLKLIKKRRGESRLSSPEALTTSKAQQKIPGTPTRVMQLLQKLFEGGYITYHRTDSTNLAPEFVESVNEWLIENHPDGENAVKDDDNKKIKSVGKGGKGGKEKEKEESPHEGIRPTDVTVRKEDVPDELQTA